MSDPVSNLPDPAALLASALHLMTRHAQVGCPTQAQLVIRQLQAVESHPDASVPPLLREVCRRLVAQWYDLLYQAQKHERAAGAALH
ncbi:MAG: hypothetical protein ACOZDY_11555 [Pseudomonadota bacterium]